MGDESPTRADVRETYDRIGSHFAKTREYGWPEVETFLAEALLSADRAVGLDLGCGNARHAESLAERVDCVLGLDVSRSLLEAGRERASDRGFGPSFSPILGDATRLPIADDAVDLAVYVATIHHLPTRADRVVSLDELARVLAPDARALVSAWATAHDRFADRVEAHRDVDATAGDGDRRPATGFDTTVEWTLPGGETVDRFYHVYAPIEFEADLEASDLEVVETTVSSGNCYAQVAGR